MNELFTVAMTDVPFLIVVVGALACSAFGIGISLGHTFGEREERRRWLRHTVAEREASMLRRLKGEPEEEE